VWIVIAVADNLVYSKYTTATTTKHEDTKMTTQHENANGKYFWTRHQITKRYQVIEQRFVGSSEVKYLLSTGKDIKAFFRDLSEAVIEAHRRQAWIDSK
jgi:hypothetical protein